jgi:hypothetical protein
MTWKVDMTSTCDFLIGCKLGDNAQKAEGCTAFEERHLEKNPSLAKRMRLPHFREADKAPEVVPHADVRAAGSWQVTAAGERRAAWAPTASP